MKNIYRCFISTILLCGFILGAEAYERTITVSNVNDLQSKVLSVQSNTEILVEDGEYNLSQTLVVDGGVRNVSIRGKSGDRDAVVIRGRGMSDESYGNVPHGFMIRNAQDVTVSDLTIRDCYYHNVIAQSEQGAKRPVLRNVRSIDAGEQHLKVTVGGSTEYCDGGLVENCRFEYTDKARSWYTNGVDVLGAKDWIVRGCTFKNIRSPENRWAGPAILFWQNCINTIVEGNTVVNCDMGISLGNSAGPGPSARDGETSFDHQGGVIRNNVVYRDADTPGDIGISVNKCSDFKIYHNTVILNDTFQWNIEYRFENCNGEIGYNLSDGAILKRNGASANVFGNIENAELDWFADRERYDLHLTDLAVKAIDAAKPLEDVKDDIDGDSRGEKPDIGADERKTTGISFFSNY